MMLQKTRAEMVSRVYGIFLSKYPDVRSLRSASVEDISKALKPLGLYKRRANWMRSISETLLKNHNGGLPRESKMLEELPGIGAYIASAILCYAYDKPVAVVDVNVARILSRAFGIEASKDIRRDKELQCLALELVPSVGFKEFNWGLMDLGASVCTARNPKHDSCPVSSFCDYVNKEEYSRRDSTPSNRGRV